MNAPLMQFVSHIDGRNAVVTLYPDRIEWERKGMSTGAKLGIGAATMGASLLVTGVTGRHDTNMVLLRSVQGVTSKKGALNTRVDVAAGASSISMNCGHTEAAQFKATVLSLLSGAMPAPAVPPLAAAPTPPPAWMPDPSRSHEYRWWDGARWTEHVSDQGIQSLDAIR